MAVSIMSSACCRVSPLSMFFLGCFFQVLIQGEVFRAPRTQDVFLRSKRANQYLVEEILQGNLERECHEEQCTYEEAREVFEDDSQTLAFWTIYYDGDQCEPNPCLHRGNCTDKVGGFQCSCVAPHYGAVCELGALGDGGRPSTALQTIKKKIFECLTEGPTACHQLCSVSEHSLACSCMTGFKLQSDGRSCQPEVEFPCGRIPDEPNTSVCHNGNCPWQVSILNNRREELCSGVLIGRRTVLTSAHCLFLDQRSHLTPSNFHVVTANKKMTVTVWALHIHKYFRTNFHDNDLALLELATPLTFSPAVIRLCLPEKDFSENILMHSGRTGIAKGWGGSQTQKLDYMMLDECRSQLNISYSLSNKMFCMRSDNGPIGNLYGIRTNQNRTRNSPNGARGILNGAENYNSTSLKIQNQEPSEADSSTWSEELQCGSLLPGMPVATVHRGTVFLTGLLISSSPDCDGGLVFTKLSRYLTWIRPRLEASENRISGQVMEYPENR